MLRTLKYIEVEHGLRTHKGKIPNSLRTKFKSQSQKNRYLKCGYKDLVFFVEIMVEYVMENMNKGLTVPKWVLIVWPKIPQMSQNLSAQFVCPSPKNLDFNEKRLHWASVVRVTTHLVLLVKGLT